MSQNREIFHVYWPKSSQNFGRYPDLFNHPVVFGKCKGQSPVLLSEETAEASGFLTSGLSKDRAFVKTVMKLQT